MSAPGFLAMMFPESWTCPKCGTTETGTTVVDEEVLREHGPEGRDAFIADERQCWLLATQAQHVCLPGEVLT